MWKLQSLINRTGIKPSFLQCTTYSWTCVLPTITSTVSLIESGVSEPDGSSTPLYHIQFLKTLADQIAAWQNRDLSASSTGAASESKSSWCTADSTSCEAESLGTKNKQDGSSSDMSWYSSPTETSWELERYRDIRNFWWSLMIEVKINHWTFGCSEGQVDGPVGLPWSRAAWSSCSSRL